MDRATLLHTRSTILHYPPFYPSRPDRVYHLDMKPSQLYQLSLASLWGR